MGSTQSTWGLTTCFFLNTLASKIKMPDPYEGIDFEEISEATGLAVDEIKCLKVCFDLFDTKKQDFLPALRHLPGRGPRHGDNEEGVEGRVQDLRQGGPGFHHNWDLEGPDHRAAGPTHRGGGGRHPGGAGRGRVRLDGLCRVLRDDDDQGRIEY